MSRESAKLVVGFVLLVAGAGALGYTIGSNGAPDSADAASARAEAQTKALAAAQSGAYAKALADGKAKGEAAGAAAGRADGGSDGFAAAGQELAAATPQKPNKDAPVDPGSGDTRPGNSGKAPGHIPKFSGGSGGKKGD